MVVAVVAAAVVAVAVQDQAMRRQAQWRWWDARRAQWHCGHLRGLEAGVAAPALAHL